RRRGAQRWSSNSFDPGPTPSQPSAHQHAEEVRTDEIAARPEPFPPRPPPASDQGLRYEPRRPRHIQKYSQTPNNAAVTALTSADTPASAISIYGCSTRSAGSNLTSFSPMRYAALRHQAGTAGSDP